MAKRILIVAPGRGPRDFSSAYGPDGAFWMTDPEIRLYNAVTSYVRNYFDQAKQSRHIAFAMIILQRRLTSSVHAILSSLERRRNRLQELLKLPDKIREDECYQKATEITGEERWAIEVRLEHLTIAGNIDDVKAELTQALWL